ncbi:MAG TPA: DNA-binding response regulator [Chitinophagaceae bacterium]|nr:DNA-binding response regulator [Chitinophagaceae bacterium]HCT24445.1 DNA-binding response regulator [Chitinophagaceae bacterium]
MAGIKILLVEDDWIIAKEITLSLNDLGFEVLGQCDNGEEALQLIHQQKPDLVLLDIGLAGEMNGIELGKQLREKQLAPFIFLTALADAATIEKAKLTEPYAYLVKPVTADTLYATIELTLHNAAQKKDVQPTPPLKEALGIGDSIFVKTRNRMEKVWLKDILWVEASDIYALICTATGKYLLNNSLKTVEEKFPDASFMRVHRSYLVNMDKVEAIEEDDILIGAARIPVGKTYRDKLMKRISFL